MEITTKKEYLKMVECANAIAFGIRIGAVSCYVNVDKNQIYPVVNSWESKHIAPFDCYWRDGKEGGTLVNIGGYGDNL